MKLLKKSISYLLLAVLLLSPLTACGKSKEKFTQYYFEYFDTVIQIIGYEESEEEFNTTCAEIECELKEYHRLFDIYYRYSGINNLAVINSDAHKSPVETDEKLIDLLTYCKEMYYETDGKVNVAMGSVLSIWHNYRTRGIDDPENAELPPMEKLQEASEHTDIESIVIDEENSTVYITDSDVKIDVGAVAKGYTAEMLYRSLKEKGKDNYLINLGGNIKAVGTASEGKKWTAGIENPDKTSDESIIEYIELEDIAIVTSGSYQRYYEVDGVSYNHIIDPETLMPAEKFLSVSIITDDSALGDVLSTALFMLDIEDGKALLEKFDNSEAMWVQKDGTRIYSDGFKNYISK